jgi:PTH1 family peptidyl-tRNA hydrolase
MKLIIGLGNPEEKYKNTRHNIGFRVLSEFADKTGIEFTLKDKFRACIAELNVNGEKVILAKPTTYYNQVGEAARLLTDFYKISPEDVLVVHDELALPFGTLRTRLGGSDAGNNGVKSMTQHLGPDTARLRIGIYNELRERMDDADFVLANWSKDESDTLDALFTKARDIIDDFIRDTFVVTSHK